MTALAEWAFAHVAPQLELRGFHTLPISLPRSDDPMRQEAASSLTNWSTPAPVARRLPYMHAAASACSHDRRRQSTAT